MADNVQVDNGSLTDYVVAGDDDGTAQHQWVKLEWGPNGTFTPVNTGASAVPIQDGGNSITVDGAVTATLASTTITANVVGTGSSTIASSRATVTTTSGSALAARATRTAVTILALGTNTDVVDIGASGVASGSGFPLAPGAYQTLNTTAAIHADAASGSQVLCFIEEFS